MEIIGQYIERAFKKSRIKTSLFASDLNTSPRNLYSIFTRESVDSEKLFLMCKILGINLFDYYTNRLIEEDPQKFAEPEAKYNRSPKRRVMVEVELDEAEYNELIKKTTR